MTRAPTQDVSRPMKMTLPALCIAITLLVACGQQPATAADAAPAPSAEMETAVDASDAPAVDGSTASSDGAMPAALTGPVIRMAASMAVAGSICEGGTIEGSSDEARAKVRAEMIAQGVAPADFDRQYDAAHAESLRKAQAMSAAERAQACAQLRQMADQMKAAAEAAGRAGG